MDIKRFDKIVGPTKEWYVTAFQEWQKDSTGFDRRVSAGAGKEFYGVFIRGFPDDFRGGLDYRTNGGDCYLLLEHKESRGILNGHTQGCYRELTGPVRQGRPNPGYFMITAGYNGLSSAVKEVEANPQFLTQLLRDVCGWGNKPEHANLFANMGRLFISTPEGIRKQFFKPTEPF